MNWNYRIMAHENETPDGENETYFKIHTVFHDDTGAPGMYSETAQEVSGSNIQEINRSLIKMQKALDKPILWYGNRFPEEYKPKQQ